VTAVRERKPQDTIMAIQSVANAATYLLLAAHAEGLGGNWICWPLYAQEETREALELSETWEPQAMIFLGWADEEPREKSLKSLEESTGVVITATAKTAGKTGVEMEALTAVSVAALTIYNMAKAAEKTMRIQNIRLVKKRGGRSGDV
jgi:hypothetical protein